MTTAAIIDPVPWTLDQCHDRIDEVRASWGWLDLLVEPGRAGAVRGPAEDEDRRELLAYRGMHVRAYREWNLRRGLGALAPHAAPARLDVLDAQLAVRRRLRLLVADVADQLADRAGVAPPAPAASVPHALDWLAGDIGPAARPWVAGVDGVHWRRGPLDDLDARTLAKVERRLADADRVARGVAGVLADPVQPLADRCPVCRGRSLQLRYDPGDVYRVADGMRPRAPSAWLVECVATSCRCEGIGCPCNQRIRYDGVRHAWAYGELGRLWLAIDRARAARRRPPAGYRAGRGGAGRYAHGARNAT